VPRPGRSAGHRSNCGSAFTQKSGLSAIGMTILVSAAVYAGTRHELDIRWVIAAAAGGAIFGDNIGFWVGREFGEPHLEKWGHLIGLDARKRMLGRYLFARYGGLNPRCLPDWR
jgi:membrane protein DedA with SNARE-associated domain